MATALCHPICDTRVYVCVYRKREYGKRVYVYVRSYMCKKGEEKRKRSNNARYSLLRVTITSYSRERLTYLSV